MGLQRKLAVLIYRSCQSARSRVSEPLTIEHVATSLGIHAGSVKTSFRRLEDKGFLKRHSFKNGRGGWAKFELPDAVFNSFLQLETEHKLNTNQTQSGNKPDTQPDTTSPSSSSLLAISDFSKTTTAGSESLPLPPEWAAIDCMPLVEQSCPFGLTQIRQARSFGMSPEALQESIYNFGWALTEGWEPPGGFQTSPLNFLMGCLKRNALFEHEGYYRQRRMRKDAEEKWLAHRRENPDQQTPGVGEPNEFGEV